ncbi:MAG TPA: hypothetical protein VGO40_00455 [Longimicrobium sp.]|jgi:hypothetical protein|nr:hypothetical protein [Longimicrobium sp.]
MSRFSRVLSLFAVPVLFAACSPGGSDTPFSPAEARHDGGIILVGGNAVPTDSTPPAGTTTSSDPAADPGVAPDSTSRGGIILVGGN